MATYPNIKFYRKDVAPSSPKDGYIWFDTSTKRLKIYKTNDWEDYTGVSDATYDNNKLCITKVAASGSDVETIEIDLAGLTNVEQKITAAINLLDATIRSNGTTALTVPSGKHVAVEVVEQNGILTSVSVLENDIASASELNTISSAVSDLGDAIDVLKGEGTGSIRDIAIDVLTETLVDENASEAYNELKEISAWIKQHPQEAATMNSDIKTLKANVQTLQNKTAVDSFGGKTGVITLKSDSITNGTVNFTMNDKQLTGTVYGLGSAAYTASTAYATAAQGTKADTAYQKPSDGIPASDLTSTVQTSLGKANSALQESSISKGETNGTIKVGTKEVAIKGLGALAYKDSIDCATSAQGNKADSALQSISSGNSTYLTVGEKDSNKNQSITPIIGEYGSDDKNGLATTSATATYVNTYVDTAINAIFSWVEY